MGSPKATKLEGRVQHLRDASFRRPKETAAPTNQVGRLIFSHEFRWSQVRLVPLGAACPPSAEHLLFVVFEVLFPLLPILVFLVLIVFVFVVPVFV